MRISEAGSLNLHADKLALLGFAGPEGVEKVVGAARSAPAEVAAYLDLNLAALADLLNAQMQQLPALSPQEAQQLAQLPCPVGAVLGPPPLGPGAIFGAAVVATATSDWTATAALPPAVDLRSGMPPVHDQGSRGTCVAFSTLAAYEHRLGAQRDLSEQFLYWNCKTNDGLPHSEGTWIRTAMLLLERDGVCDEAGWPYVAAALCPPNVSQGPAPAEALLAAQALQPRPLTQEIGKNDVTAYKQALNAGRCIAVNIPVFESWHASAHVRKYGELTLPFPGEIAASGHAVCIVGYVDDDSPQYPGGGYFVMRNSWGTAWAAASAHAPGYGTIPYAYIQRWGNEAWIICS